MLSKDGHRFRYLALRPSETIRMYFSAQALKVGSGAKSSRGFSWAAIAGGARLLNDVGAGGGAIALHVKTEPIAGGPSVFQRHVLKGA